MKYLHIKELSIPLYRGRLVIIITNDEERLVEKLPDFYSEELYAHTRVTNWDSVQGFIIILNFDNPNRKITNGIIAHEVIHATHFILQCRGVIADFENDEPVSYLAEFITDEIYKFMKKKKIKATV